MQEKYFKKLKPKKGIRAVTSYTLKAGIADHGNTGYYSKQGIHTYPLR